MKVFRIFKNMRTGRTLQPMYAHAIRFVVDLHAWAAAGGGGGKSRPSPPPEKKGLKKCTQKFLTCKTQQKAPIVCYARNFYHKRPPCYALNFHLKRPPCIQFFTHERPPIWYALKFSLKRPPCYALIFFQKGHHVMR